MKIERSKFLRLCLSMMPVAALACGGSGRDDTGSGGSDFTGSSSGASAPSPPTPPAQTADVVTVTTTPISTQGDNCTAEVKAPKVSIPTNPTAEKAINDALAPIGAPCAEGGVSTQSSFEVGANGQGLLSIVVRGARFFAGEDAFPFTDTYNFDVKNGGKIILRLDTVVTDDGQAKEVTACMAALGAPTTGSGSISDQECHAAVTGDPNEGLVPTWIAKPEGLELIAKVTPEQGDTSTSVVPWKDLVASGLKDTIVLEYAKAQK